MSSYNPLIFIQPLSLEFNQNNIFKIKYSCLRTISTDLLVSTINGDEKQRKAHHKEYACFPP